MSNRRAWCSLVKISYRKLAEKYFEIPQKINGYLTLFAHYTTRVTGICNNNLVVLDDCYTSCASRIWSMIVRVRPLVCNIKFLRIYSNCSSIIKLFYKKWICYTRVADDLYTSCDFRIWSVKLRGPSLQHKHSLYYSNCSYIIKLFYKK